MKLPPGQHAVGGFPRFGTHLHRPPPVVPAEPAIELSGAVRETVAIPIADLGALPRREVTADFHCVAGWSATNLRWEGFAFDAFWDEFIEPRLMPDRRVTHLVLAGLDGYQWTALLKDLHAKQVLIADRLDGRPLGPDHGAPVRLVSPNQYGYVNVKHLARIELLTGPRGEDYGAPRWVEAALRSPLVKPHPRARVWQEERNRYLPGPLVRPFYRLLVPPIRWLSGRAPRPRPRGEPR